VNEVQTRKSTDNLTERHVKPLKPFYLDLDESEIQAIQTTMGDILRRGELILGKYTDEFEREFANYAGCKHAVTLNTATSALEILATLKGARGKKVAVPSNTNFASVAAILRAGGEPVYMDMTAEYFAPNLDVLKYTVEKYGVQGVMWVHIGGIIVPEFFEVAEYCRSKRVFLIEDAAHAHGSWLGGKCAGTFADGGAFSFFPTKVMTTMEGGMITTDSQEHANLAKSFRNQGKRHGAYGGLHYDLGSSWRMSEISAYIGLVQLAKLDRMTATRQRAVDIVAGRLKKLNIGYCDTSHMEKASQYKFIIRLSDGLKADQVKKDLAALGIICGGGVYEIPCHLQPVFSDFPAAKDELRVTEAWCPRHICPPITSGTTTEDAERVGAALADVVR
jgi:dTDP-4-amino-4,6-dideoxygalactose transaminase